MPQKLITTACFIQEESSGGKQFRQPRAFESRLAPLSRDSRL